MKNKPLEALDLALWLKENYTLYASSSGPGTRAHTHLYANHYGELRVTKSMEILYEGPSMQTALSIYNENT